MVDLKISFERRRLIFRIGEFSKMSKTTIKALRYYDEIGLLKPAYIDKFTNYRFYTTDQLFDIHNIQSLRQIGLSTDKIKLILSQQDCEKILENHKDALEAEINEIKSQLLKTQLILKEKKEEKFMEYKAVIKDLPECIIYSKKLKAPDYESYFKLIPAIGREVMTEYPDLKCSTPPYCFINYLDGEYREKEINIELCEAVTELKKDFGEIKFRKLESVPAVTVMHKGPYSKFRRAYAFAFKWIEENGYRITDNPRESYIDGIWNKDSEEDWLTEIQIPIEK